MTDFEQAKTKMNELAKAVTQAETTVAVVGQQMDALKQKRAKYEKECLEKTGVSIDKLDDEIKRMELEYIEMTRKASEALSKIQSPEES